MFAIDGPFERFAYFLCLDIKRAGDPRYIYLLCSLSSSSSLLLSPSLSIVDILVDRYLLDMNSIHFIF